MNGLKQRFLAFWRSTTGKSGGWTAGRAGLAITGLALAVGSSCGLAAITIRAASAGEVANTPLAWLLLIGLLLIPALVVSGVITLRAHRREAERARETALRAYLEGLTRLLHDLEVPPGEERQQLLAQARARADAILVTMKDDTPRRCAVVEALARAGLISAQGIEMSRMNMSHANLADADLRGAVLTGADLRGARLRDANLREARLARATLAGANLRGARLRSAELHEADLRDTVLTGATLWGASLTEANLRGARLRACDLTRTKIVGADLTDAALWGAELRDADLRGANLTRAKVTGTDLTGANLSHTNLTGADFREANFTGARIVGAMLRATVLPDGSALPDDDGWESTWLKWAQTHLDVWQYAPEAADRRSD
ncbi:MAG: pentapeptide repeat-containing protein [Anaerolineae bacterium]|nr:pentapeptide repeat-containing protein [Anaerolineae bacterium]